MDVEEPARLRTRDELWSSIISHLMASRVVAVQASTPTDFVFGVNQLFFLGSRGGSEPATLHAIDLPPVHGVSVTGDAAVTLQEHQC